MRFTHSPYWHTSVTHRHPYSWQNICLFYCDVILKALDSMFLVKVVINCGSLVLAVVYPEHVVLCYCGSSLNLLSVVDSGLNYIALLLVLFKLFAMCQTALKANRQRVC